MPLAKIAEVAIVNLQPDLKFVRDLRRDVSSEVREGSAAVAGMRAQPVVLVGVKKSLRGETVKLNRAVEELELLCLQNRGSDTSED